MYRKIIIAMLLSYISLVIEDRARYILLCYEDGDWFMYSLSLCEDYYKIN